MPLPRRSELRRIIYIDGHPQSEAYASAGQCRVRAPLLAPYGFLLACR
jgi:hypothetical protein